MANTSILTLSDDEWFPVATGAAETLLTSDGNGFLYAISATTPNFEFGHVVDGWTNEPVVTLAGETLYVRSRSGAITLVSTTDAGA